ncbi:MAG: extracellular solute-binding protein, partial [Trebonia sp.]
MMKKARTAAVAALGVSVVLAAAACSSGGSSGGGSSSSASGPVTLTFWNNATPGPGLTYYQNAIKQFEAAHPGVTIKMQAIQNEDYDGKLQTALASNSAPDIFFQRGGGKMQAMVNAGQLQALNLSATDKTNIGAGAPVDS